MVCIETRRGKTIFIFPHIEGITLDAIDGVDEVAGGASAMDVDRIGEVNDRASERQVAGVYGTGFTVESMVRVGARGVKL